MGLTIQYGIRSRTRGRPAPLVERMRQLALDLPFDNVGEIIHCQGDCDAKRWRGVDEDLFSFLLGSQRLIRCPWNSRRYMPVYPEEAIGFMVEVGEGSEWLDVGLARYPKEVDYAYDPEDDAKLQEAYHPHGSSSTAWRFSYRKWRRWLERRGLRRYESPTQFKEVRKIKTRLGGWSWASFCKTQYASDPACGGLANFLRCHIAVITLLERIAQLPTITMEIDDEGHYATAHYSDDWREAWQEGREPTYVWHEATHSPAVLAKQVADYNQIVAAMVGAMSDALGPEFHIESPIKRFADFERLEFTGAQDEAIKPFLEAMAAAAKAAAKAAVPSPAT